MRQNLGFWYNMSRARSRILGYITYHFRNLSSNVGAKLKVVPKRCQALLMQLAKDLTDRSEMRISERTSCGILLILLSAKQFPIKFQISY
jgi:hypothetical protein